MLKSLFFILFVKPLVLFIAGVHVKGRKNLPKKGPCIIAANHNSHLDTLVLMSLFPSAMVSEVRPVAAADYFMKNWLVAWLSKALIGIIPLQRKPTKAEGHPLAEVHKALEAGEIVIIFPEGSRGEPEKLAPFKNGITHLVKAFTEVPVVPVCLYGAGKSLPKDEVLFVPFVIDVNIGVALRYENEHDQTFAETLQKEVTKLQQSMHTCSPTI
ncbi:MAG: lysophospholipid acyltransferase family protein [Campylobacterota bacterium]